MARPLREDFFLRLPIYNKQKYYRMLNLLILDFRDFSFVSHNIIIFKDLMKLVFFYYFFHGWKIILGSQITFTVCS